MTIPRDQLVDRGVYTIRSRNLMVGVWHAERGGFIGIREKFGSEYLFMEYFADGVSPVGTAAPLEFIEQLPEGIEVIENTPTICKQCFESAEDGRERLATFHRSAPPDPTGVWRHDDDGSEMGYPGHSPISRDYKPLFDYLKPHDEAASAAYLARLKR